LEAHMKLLIALLKDDGKMVHIINFTDHGMFSPIGNRFMFRKISNPIYNLIMGPVGRPNRILPSDFINFFESAGYTINCNVIRTHTRVLFEKEEYSIDSIPKSELDELLVEYALESQKDLKVILDMCIGSAVFTITKNV